MQCQLSGEEIVRALVQLGYTPTIRTDTHLQLRYIHPETYSIRQVTVPLYDEIHPETLQFIADQCGASDVQSWCASLTSSHDSSRESSRSISDTTTTPDIDRNQEPDG